MQAALLVVPRPSTWPPEMPASTPSQPLATRSDRYRTSSDTRCRPARHPSRFWRPRPANAAHGVSSGPPGAPGAPSRAWTISRQHSRTCRPREQRKCKNERVRGRAAGRPQGNVLAHTIWSHPNEQAPHLRQAGRVCRRRPRTSPLAHQRTCLTSACPDGSLGIAR